MSAIVCPHCGADRTKYRRKLNPAAGWKIRFLCESTAIEGNAYIRPYRSQLCIERQAKQNAERERDEAREAFGKTIEGVIDGGDTKEGYLMVQVPVPPTGYRVGQIVKVLLPEKESAK